jgi:predicted nucleic acid-binding protein
VVDASAVVTYLLVLPTGAALSEAILQGDELHTPALCDLEFASALRRAAIRGAADKQRIAEALSAYLALPIERHGHETLLPRVLDLRHSLSAYDAAYVALAEHLQATLLTGDQRLARAIQASRDIRVTLM